MPLIPEDEINRIHCETDLDAAGRAPGKAGRLSPEKTKPVALTIQATSVEDGQIVVRPLLVSGPVRLFVVDGTDLPPELLERLIVLPNEPEDERCP